MTLKQPGAVAAFVAYLVFAYGKDAGKFWLIKYTSALRQKVLALLFPFGTWFIGLIFFYGGGKRHYPTLGVAWELPASLLELLGFMIILLANIGYVLLKTKGFTWPTFSIPRLGNK